VVATREATHTTNSDETRILLLVIEIPWLLNKPVILWLDGMLRWRSTMLD